MKQITAALCIFCSVQIFGLDFGIDTRGRSSATAYADSNESPEPESTVSLNGWIRNPVADGSFSFRGGAIFSSDTEEILPTLTALNWQGFIDPDRQMHLSIGRIGTSDPSGLIGRSPVDGAAFKMRTAGMNLLFNAGYAGFIFKEDTNISVTPNDIFQVADEDKVFGVPRAVVTAVLGIPGISGRHDLDLQLTGQFDIWDSSGGGYEPLHTQYAGIHLQGPIQQGFYYNVSGVLGTAGIGSGSAGVSGAGRARLSWLNTALKSLRISAGAAAASGDPDRDAFISDDGSGSQFIPIVPQTIGHALELSLPNNLIGELAVSIKPLERLIAEFAVIPVYRLTDGPVNYPGSVEAGMAGVETDITAAFAPTSDLRIDLAGGLFFPSSGNTLDGYKSTKWNINGSVTLKM